MMVLDIYAYFIKLVISQKPKCYQIMAYGAIMVPTRNVSN